MLSPSPSHLLQLGILSLLALSSPGSAFFTPLPTPTIPPSSSPTSTSAVVLAFTTPALATAQPQQPGQQPLLHDPRHPLLLRRQDSACPAAFTGCANYNLPTVCCSTADICTVDNAGNVACCPSGAACTGTIGGTGAAAGGAVPSTTEAVGGISVTSDAAVASLSNGGVILTVVGGMAPPRARGGFAGDGRYAAAAAAVGAGVAVGLLGEYIR